MNIKYILARIDERQAALGMTDRALSLAVGSADLIRNWRRAAREGKNPRIAHENLLAVADRLGVSPDWMSGETASDTAPPPQLAESATPYRLDITPPKPEDDPATAALRAVFGTSAVKPATLRIHTDHPEFGLVAGDLAVVDLARPPRIGEIAVASLYDDKLGVSTSIFVRVATPWLLPGRTHGASAPIAHDDPDIALRYPVIGVIRGAAQRSGET